MADAIEGQTVRVTTKGSEGGEPAVSYYAVAEPDPGEAVALVRDEIGAAPDDLVEVVAPLTAEKIAALRLGPGQFERL
jgi:hypothetical protein